MRTEGESQGFISKTMDVDGISGENLEETKDELTERRVPFVMIRARITREGVSDE